jgi:hypothetical protein
MPTEKTADQFRRDVEARIAAHAPAMAPGAPNFKAVGQKVKGALGHVDDFFAKYKGVIEAATPDQYDGYVELAASLIAKLSGHADAPATTGA